MYRFWIDFGAKIQNAKLALNFILRVISRYLVTFRLTLGNFDGGHFDPHFGIFWWANISHLIHKNFSTLFTLQSSLACFYKTSWIGDDQYWTDFMICRQVFFEEANFFAKVLWYGKNILRSINDARFRNFWPSVEFSSFTFHFCNFSNFVKIRKY